MLSPLEELRIIRSESIKTVSASPQKPPTNPTKGIAQEDSPIAPDSLSELNTTLDRLHLLIIRLRCSDPPKGSRAAGLAYLSVHRAIILTLHILRTAGAFHQVIGEGWFSVPQNQCARLK